MEGVVVPEARVALRLLVNELRHFGSARSSLPGGALIGSRRHCYIPIAALQVNSDRYRNSRASARASARPSVFLTWPRLWQGPVCGPLKWRLESADAWNEGPCRFEGEKLELYRGAVAEVVALLLSPATPAAR